MPSYRYVAIDPSGRQVEGTVQSPSLREASLELRGKGLKVSKVVEGSPAPIPSPLANAPPPAASPTISRPATLPRAPTTSSIVRTRPGSNKDLFILFSQMSSYFRVGISPAQAFSDLQSRMGRHKGYVQSLGDLHAASSAGRRISDEMERYPDLYPPHVVGMIRAGETGGFLPEAAVYVAKQAEDSMKWSRPFWVITWMVGMMLIAMPLAFVAITGLLDTWTAMDKGGDPGGVSTLAEKSGRLLIWPLGPAILAGYLLLFLLRTGWRSLKMRRWRHGLAYVWPVFRKRTSAEGAATFAWALSNLSKAGIAPYSAWQLAVEAVPNTAYKAKLIEAGRSMHERTPLSEALSRTRVLPPETAMIVHTGEVTGTVPNALIDAANMSQTEFDSLQTQNKRFILSWTFLLFGLGFVFYIWLIYSYFYPEFMRRFTAE